MASGSWMAFVLALVPSPLALMPSPLASATHPAAVPARTSLHEVLLANGAARPRRGGSELRINSTTRRGVWQWFGPSGRSPGELWLPLEVLQDQLGVSSRAKPDGTLDLEWFGRGLLVPAAAQRTLGDEVAVDAAPLLRQLGVETGMEGEVLSIRLPRPRLLQVRDGRQPGVRRLVLDLSGPVAVLRESSGIRLDLAAGQAQQARLGALGVGVAGSASGLELKGTTGARVFTLGDPARVVIDLPSGSGGGTASGSAGPAPVDPRLRALLGPELEWDRQVLTVGKERVRVNSVRMDPRSSSLELKPLSRPGGMEGLSSLAGLAQHHDALVAINGGFFNRVRKLPLGALREGGRWLSGPILNRGVVAWEPRSVPRFGRLRLNEWLSDREGRRWPIVVVNSGYVQRGISRYTPEWGPYYRALSGSETALLLRNGTVLRRYGSADLQRGIPLRGSDTLLVGRGGVGLPWREGEVLRLESSPSDTLGSASFVVGGGPLLLQNGRIVLNGTAEGFSGSFLRQGAPRTVIGSDGRRIWLLTLEGVDDPGPTLMETARLLRSLGLRDALNLDGGSSTGLVMGGSHTVKGRGVAGSVHHGLGLVPAGRPAGPLGAS